MARIGASSAIAHGSLTRPGARQPLQLVELPAWHGWRYRSLTARVVRWIEAHITVPTGYGAGHKMKIAPFQRKIIEALYESRAAVVSMPAGNGKTTLLAALALERICRGDDYVEVDVVATKADQAALLVEAAKRMVEASPALVPLCAYSADSATLDYRVTGSKMRAQPAKLSAVQGLNFSVAIVDEIGFASDAVVHSLIARVGKRPDAAVIGIGTPGLEPNVMLGLRERRDELADLKFTYLEWAAPAGCEIGDRTAWRQANPALAARFLSEDALALQAVMLPETEFRVYHLGQWPEGSQHSWLPDGAWDGCGDVAPPPEGTPVVLAFAGTWRSSLALVGCTLDGAVFVAWERAEASDDEVADWIRRGFERWHVLELVVAPRCRANLVAMLEVDGLPLWKWRPADDVPSAAAWRQAIVEGRIAHDHHPVLAGQVAAQVGRSTKDGSLVLEAPDDRTPVDAARAARMAWWRVVDQPRVEEPNIY